jgi:hypothetical protein
MVDAALSGSRERQLAAYREIVGTEKSAHRLYRKIRHRPIAELRTPELASVFLDRWRTLHVSSNEGAHMPDPRRRSIGAAMKALDVEEARRRTGAADIE